uniref:tripartite tricarboxylate transporter substrate-binding protein n=1 Tax=Cupriavidus ulmosensis TaxID=3065913 RepID=UPI003F82F865
MNYAATGIGMMTLLAAATMFRERGLAAMHVPYHGNGAAMTDVLKYFSVTS